MSPWRNMWAGATFWLSRDAEDEWPTEFQESGLETGCLGHPVLIVDLCDDEPDKVEIYIMTSSFNPHFPSIPYTCYGPQRYLRLGEPDDLIGLHEKRQGMSLITVARSYIVSIYLLKQDPRGRVGDFEPDLWELQNFEAKCARAKHISDCRKRGWPHFPLKRSSDPLLAIAPLSHGEADGRDDRKVDSKEEIVSIPPKTSYAATETGAQKTIKLAKDNVRATYSGLFTGLKAAAATHPIKATRTTLTIRAKASPVPESRFSEKKLLNDSEAASGAGIQQN